MNFDIRHGQRGPARRAGLGDGLYRPTTAASLPRLGFAWTANDKTVVRGGYGMVQYQEGTGANCRCP